ncbi:MAG: uroporphyrinogen-III C-methyltransferase [Candidatus Hydrothermarchaeaceae archaeon]
MAKVYLVGAGPGDPGLITVRGLELIKRADVIIYDRLAGEKLLAHARKDAELVYVGKRTGRHNFRQDEINRIIVEKAVGDKIVVRLKGGDPFVFGRGGEEIDTLRKNKIPYEVVPGVTSAIAVPAIVGVPVTDRRYASSFTVVTGREDPTKEEAKLDYGKLAADTIVILMGIGNLENIVSQMLKTRRKDTPVAIIEEGTTERQKVIEGTLGDIVEKAEKERIKPPAIIVIGEVVKLREIEHV